MALGVVLRFAVLPDLGVAVGREALDGELLVEVGVGVLVDHQQLEVAVSFQDGVGGEVLEVAAGRDHLAAGLDDLRCQLLGEIVGVRDIGAG